jgi:twitching motility two-component system response regulator PilG
VPVIVLTNREGTLNRLKARLAGACEYRSKPFRQEDIVAILRQYPTTQKEPEEEHGRRTFPQHG